MNASARLRCALLAVFLLACADARPEGGASAGAGGRGGAGVGGAGAMAGAGAAGTAATPAGMGASTAGTLASDMFSGSADRLRDALGALQEPDFMASVDAIAQEHCGYVLRLTQRVESDDPLSAVGAIQERAFDAEGRLLVVTSDAAHDGIGVGDARRIQFDHDDRGRVTRWRRGGILPEQIGDIVEIEYAADGSFSAEVVSNAPSVIWRGEALPAAAFCQRLDFDAQGRLVAEHWGCEQLVEARAYQYDGEGRLAEVRGQGLLDLFGTTERDLRFGEPDQWTIRFTYDDAGDHTVVWNETQVTAQGVVELEQRIVRDFDDAGKLVQVDFDRGNDGTFDERIRYEYEGERRVAERRDVLLDGVVDWSERDGDEYRERRNLLQQGDDSLYMYSLGHFGSASPQVQDGSFPVGLSFPVLQDGRRVGTSPQSQGAWDFGHDAQGRLVSASLDAWAIDFAIPEPNTISVAASLEQLWGDAGFVEQVTMEQTRGPGEIHTSVQTTCTLTAPCGEAEIVAPEDPSLLACQPNVFQPSQGLVEPYVEPPFLPPPFDRIAAFERRNRYAVRFSFDFATIREIVGY